MVARRYDGHRVRNYLKRFPNDHVLKLLYEHFKNQATPSPAWGLAVVAESVVFDKSSLELQPAKTRMAKAANPTALVNRLITSP